VTPEGKTFLWLNLQRTVDKRGGTGKKGLEGAPSESNKNDSDEQKKVARFAGESKRGDIVEVTDVDENEKRSSVILGKK